MQLRDEDFDHLSRELEFEALKFFILQQRRTLRLTYLTYPEVENDSVFEVGFLRDALLTLGPIVYDPLELMNAEQLAALLNVVGHTSIDIDPLNTVLMDIEGQCAFERFVGLEEHPPAVLYHGPVEGLSHLACSRVGRWHDEAAALVALAKVLHLDRISGVTTGRVHHPIGALLGGC